METGGQYVMTHGPQLMQTSPADNWDFQILVGLGSFNACLYLSPQSC